MSWLPITETLTVQQRSQTGVDSHRNPVYGWVDEPWPVYCWQPGAAGQVSSYESPIAGPNRVLIGRTVFAPTPPKYTDRVVFPDGAVFEVDGEPEDWNHGFHGWQPGYQVYLKKIDG